eukprot:3548927-Amphidinium_carterae.1
MRASSVPLVAFADASEDDGLPCTPGATVSKGTSCEVEFTHCSVHAEMRCIGGQVVVDVEEPEEASDNELSSFQACIQAGKDFMIAGASPI